MDFDVTRAAVKDFNTFRTNKVVLIGTDVYYLKGNCYNKETLTLETGVVLYVNDGRVIVLDDKTNEMWDVDRSKVTLKD
jgi:hypothetical protein